MAIDQPITVYPKDKGEKGEKKHTRAEMQKIADDWIKKYGKPGAVAEKIKLSGFMSDHNINTK